MTPAEWQRLIAAHGSVPRIRPGSLTCPVLSATGRCTAYTARPFICRLWGTTRELACPQGCQPEHWLTTEEAHAIFRRVREIGGADIVVGTMHDVPIDLWEAIGLEARKARTAKIKEIQRGRTA